MIDFPTEGDVGDLRDGNHHRNSRCQDIDRYSRGAMRPIRKGLPDLSNLYNSVDQKERVEGAVGDMWGQ